MSEGKIRAEDLRLAAKAFLVGWTRAQAILAGVEPPPKAGPMGIFLKMVAEEVGTEAVGRRTEIITDALEEAHDDLKQKKAAEVEDERDPDYDDQEEPEDKPLPERLKISERARGYERWVRRAASRLEGYDVDTRMRGEDVLMGRLTPGKVGALPRPRYEVEDPHELAHEVILALYRAAGRGRWRFEVKLEGWNPELEDEESAEPAPSLLSTELGVAVFGEPQEDGYEHLAFENLYKLEDFACDHESALRALHARIGLAVAERLAPNPVFFGGCVGGWIGYLPTADEYVAGGWEVELAPVVYGPLTGWLSPALPETASTIVDRAVELVEETFAP